MRVTVVAWPQTIFSSGFDPALYPDIDYTPHDTLETPADELAEFAGRACYESWERPNPKTATNNGYVANILDHKHFSVIEHASFTLWITGVSRSLSHEVVRHRHFSYSQRSQRYVDESQFDAVIHPAIRDLQNGPVRHSILSSLESKFDQARSAYKYIYDSLVANGASKKTARGAARSVLPNAAETKLVVTGNLRAWLEFFDKRLSDGADEEIRELSIAVLNAIRPFAPNTLQEIKGWYDEG
jgi:thymidylate synthase (FAD)